MINIKFSVDNKKLAKKISSIQPTIERGLHKVGIQEVANVKNRITTTKTSPDGQRWAAWSIATIRQRIRERNIHLGLLYRTGNLLRSIYYKVVGNTLEVGSSAPYSEFLQNGTTRMPSRRFLGFTRETINKLRRIISTELNK